MKILFLGTICEINEYEKMLQKCQSKPTVATIIFENSLLKGFKGCKADIEIYSYPMIPYYFTSKLLYWGNKKELLECGYNCTWLKTINLPLLKQLSRRIDGRHVIKQWIKKNRGEECIILTYSIPPFLATSLVEFGKKYHVKVCAIIPDLLRDMYMNSNDVGIKKFLRNRYLKKALKVQGSLDGYIYLTEEMKNVVNPNKPYMVMEGVADIDITPNINMHEKNNVKAIMYAGTLHKKYGILNLIEAFLQVEKVLNRQIELWIFGDGDAEEEIKKYVLNNKYIYFGGRKNREEILKLEKKASLLVNVRNVEDEFTKYSFPSKTIEYMLSGTPVLTTELRGIPLEYYNYIFHIKNNHVDTIADELRKIFTLSDEQLISYGISAQEFIQKNKSGKVQAKKIIDFFSLVEKDMKRES